MAKIVDNSSQKRLLFNKGVSTGSIYNGVTAYPMRKFRNNFAVVSTDYENYAILYECTYKTAMYNKDMITILTRDPNLSVLESGTEQLIRDEFNRIFGGGLDEEMD